MKIATLFLAAYTLVPLFALASNAPSDDNDTSYTTRTAVMAITEKNVHGTVGGKNPAHLRSGGGFLSIDFLYWKANEDGLSVGTKAQALHREKRLKYEEVELNATWRPGLRAGIGWLFGEADQWEVDATWTGFYDKSAEQHTYSRSDHKWIIPSWSSILGPIALGYKASWSLHLNTADFEVARNYFISRNIALRPHAGVRAAWIDQKYHANYLGEWHTRFTPGEKSTPLQGETSFKADWEYKGGGPLCGVDLMWHFSKRCGLLTQVSGALLYGSFRVSEEFFGGQQVLDEGKRVTLIPLDIAYKSHFDRVRASLEGFIGFFFETGISNDKYHFSLAGGYEVAEWFQQNELAGLSYEKDSRVFKATAQIPPALLTADNEHVLTVRQTGNLGLQGLTIKAVFNF